MYWNLVFVYLKPLACINNCKGRYVVYIKFVMPSTFIFYHWFKISKWQARRKKNWRKKRFVIVTLNSLNLRLGKSKQPYILFSVFFLFLKGSAEFLVLQLYKFCSYFLVHSKSKEIISCIFVDGFYVSHNSLFIFSPFLHIFVLQKKVKLTLKSVLYT